MKTNKILLMLIIIWSVFYINAFAEEIKVPVLLYHNIEENYNASDAMVQITPQNFNSHMDRLIDEGYNTIDFKEYYEHVTAGAKLPSKPVIIAFDDGYTSNYIFAYPTLKSRGMKATIFAITGRMGAKNTSYPHFTWAEAAEMQQSGVIDIQSHGDFHPTFTEISEGQQVLELRRSKYLLETRLNKDFFVVAFPYGMRNQSAYEAARSAGFNVQCLVGDKGYNSAETTGVENIKRLTVSGNMTDNDLIEMIEKNMA